MPQHLVRVLKGDPMGGQCVWIVLALEKVRKVSTSRRVIDLKLAHRFQNVNCLHVPGDRCCQNVAAPLSLA